MMFAAESSASRGQDDFRALPAQAAGIELTLRNNAGKNAACYVHELRSGITPATI